jgi:hypothetical protein
MSNNNINFFEVNSKVQSKNHIQALDTEYAVLLKRIETIENNNQNLIALTATCNNNKKFNNNNLLQIQSCR